MRMVGKKQNEGEKNQACENSAIRLIKKLKTSKPPIYNYI